MPGPINGEGTRPHCSWDGVLPPVGGAVLVLLAPLREVSVVCLHGGGRGILFLFGREGLILDKDPPVLFLFPWRQEKCPIAPCPHPHPVGHIASATGQESIRFWQRSTGVPALSLPATSWPALPWFPLPACCHCRLPPQLSPLGMRDSVARAPPVTTFPSSPSAHHGHPACKSQHACVHPGGLPTPVNSLGPGVRGAPYSGKIFLINALISTPDPLRHGARFPRPRPARKVVTF